jgi:hypothetical protein
MRARNLMLAAIGGGTLLGTLGGLAIDTDMKPPPEPSWRHAVQRDFSTSDSYAFIDSGPQDLSPTWYLDRMPTWKRRLLYREAEYAPLPDYQDFTAELDDELPAPADDRRDPAPWLEPSEAAAAALDAADAAREAARTASAPTAAEREPTPADDEAAAL